MAAPRPNRLTRSPRPVAKPFKGRILYLVAGAFALATAGIVALWVVKAIRVEGLEAKLTGQLAGKDHSGALESVRRLSTVAFRWSRPEWKQKEARILLEWAEHLFEDKKYEETLKKADAADKVAHEGGLRDAEFADRLHEVLANAAIEDLKAEWENWPAEEKISRLERIVTRHGKTQAAGEARKLLARLQQELKEYLEKWAALLKSADRQEANGLVGQALSNLKAFGKSKELADFRYKDHRDQLNSRIARLEQYLEKGFYVFPHPTMLPVGDRPASSDAAIATIPGQDSVPLYRKGPGPSGTLAPGDDDFFVTRLQGMLYALSARSGNLLWIVDQGMGTSLAPVRIGPDLICISGGGKYLSRLNGLTGRTVWSAVLAVPPACDPVPVENGIALLDQDGTVSVIATGFDEPRIVARYGAGETGLSRLVSDRRYHLALDGTHRTVLLEAGENGWFKVAVVVLYPRRGDRVCLMDRFACVLPGGILSDQSHKRLFLWRDRSITPVAPPPVSGSWRLVDHRDGLQLWCGPRGDVHCTWLDQARLDSPMHKLADLSVAHFVSGRLKPAPGTGHGVIVTGDSVRHLSLPSPTRTGPAPSPGLRWQRQITSASGLNVTALRILDCREDTVVVAGTDGRAPVLACLSVGNDGKPAWTSQFGPSPDGPPAVSDDLAVWSDGHAGLWAMDAKGGVRHHLSDGISKADRRMRMTGDGRRFLTCWNGELMLYDGDLKALWTEPVKDTGRIASVCLRGGEIIVTDTDGMLSALSAKTGKPAALPAGMPTRLPGQRSGPAQIISGKAGIWSSSRDGWRVLPSGPGPLGPGLNRLLYQDDKVLVAGSETDGTVACFDLSTGGERWRAAAEKVPASPLWANPTGDGHFVVLTQSGDLLKVDAKGLVGPAGTLPGPPTAQPARFGGALWVPVNGYRIVKIPLARLGLAGLSSP